MCSVIGAGGIGCPAIQYLAAAGVGHLTIIDDDVVSLSNLQRQVLYTSDDVGQPKVERRRRVGCARSIPMSRSTRCNAGSTADDTPDLLDGVDVVLDGSDNFMTRLIVNDLAVAARVPLVSAAIGQFHGSSAPSADGRRTSPATAVSLATRMIPMIATAVPKSACWARWSALMGSFAAMEAIRVHHWIWRGIKRASSRSLTGWRQTCARSACRKIPGAQPAPLWRINPLVTMNS